MPYSLWSDPYNDKATAAQLQAGEKFQAPQISGIVAAILQARQHENALKQQQMNSLISGIGSAATGYAKMGQAGQADDTANAAIYGMQYPNDPYGGFQDPGRVPDYGGQEALNAQKYIEQQQLNQQRINAQQALEYDRWNRGSGSGMLTPAQQAVQDRFNAREERLKLNSDAISAQQELKGYGFTNDKGQVQIPAGLSDYNLQPNQSVTQGGQPVTPQQFAQMQAAAKRYQDIIAQRSQSNAPGPNVTNPYNPSNQSSQSQANQALSGGSDNYSRAVKLLQDNGKPVTDANVKYIMDQLATMNR